MDDTMIGGSNENFANRCIVVSMGTGRRCANPCPVSEMFSFR